MRSVSKLPLYEPGYESVSFTDGRNKAPSPEEFSPEETGSSLGYTASTTKDAQKCLPAC